MTVLLIRPNRNDDDYVALEKLGVPARIDPYLSVSRVDNPHGSEKLLRALENDQLSWLVVTSVNAFELWSQQVDYSRLSAILCDEKRVRTAAIGASTAQTLRDHGAQNVLVPRRADSADLAALLLAQQPTTVVIPSGNISMKAVPNECRQHGVRVLEEVVYETRTAATTPSSVHAIANGEVRAVLFRSPSAVRAFREFVPSPPPQIALVAAGNTTAQWMAASGLTISAISPDPTPDTVAHTIAALLKG